MDKEQQQFLALLRSGLWNTPVDAGLFSGTTDWNALFAQASRQTVSGIVASAAGTLPTALRPAAPVADKMRSLVTASIRSHALLNRTLAEAVNLLRRNGIRPVLLKGQGVATNYAEPTLRMCGDIDLYIGKQDYGKACALARAWNKIMPEEAGNTTAATSDKAAATPKADKNTAASDEEGTESIKHYHFKHGSVTVELHRIAEQLPLPWRNARFQRWTQKHLHNGSSLRSILIEGTEISLPPVNFDALYIFNHAWHHFSQGGGIGLRQLCDWVRYLHTFRTDIDHAALRRDLKAFGLWRPWRMFSTIAVDTLGLPREEYPFYTHRYTRKADRITAMIEAGGNFGFYDTARTPRPDGYLAGKMHSLRWICRRYARIFPLCPGETVAAWVHILYIGIGRVLTDQLPAKRQQQLKRQLPLKSPQPLKSSQR